NRTMVETIRALSDQPNIQLGTDNVLNNRGGSNDTDGYQVRIDHQIGNNTTLFARYNDFQNLAVTPRNLRNGSTTDKPRGQVAAGWNQIFGPNMLLTTRAAFTTAPWGSKPEFNPSQDEWRNLGWPTVDAFGAVRLRIDQMGTIGIGGDPNARTIEDQIQLS